VPKCKIFDELTQQAVEGINFGGSPQEVYDVNGTLVYAPSGGTDIITNVNTKTLNPLGLTSEDIVNNWVVISHQDIGTCNWRVTIQNSLTNEIKSGVYPFNLEGQVYQLECGGNEWVMASCGGYEIQAGDANPICYTLLGTNEIIKVSVGFSGIIIFPSRSVDNSSFLLFGSNGSNGSAWCYDIVMAQWSINQQARDSIFDYGKTLVKVQSYVTCGQAKELCQSFATPYIIGNTYRFVPYSQGNYSPTCGILLYCEAYLL